MDRNLLFVEKGEGSFGRGHSRSLERRMNVSMVFGSPFWGGAREREGQEAKALFVSFVVVLMTFCKK